MVMTCVSSHGLYVPMIYIMCVSMLCVCGHDLCLYVHDLCRCSYDLFVWVMLTLSSMFKKKKLLTIGELDEGGHGSAEQQNSAVSRV